MQKKLKPKNPERKTKMHLYEVSYKGPTENTPELEAEKGSIKFYILAENFDEATAKAKGQVKLCTLHTLNIKMENFDKSVLS